MKDKIRKAEESIKKAEQNIKKAVKKNILKVLKPQAFLQIMPTRALSFPPELPNTMPSAPLSSSIFFTNATLFSSSVL